MVGFPWKIGSFILQSIFPDYFYFIMTKAKLFRRLVESPEILMLPGVHDVLSAKIAEQAGFKAITCGGYAISATLLGAPDTSQLSVTEMSEQYARLCDAVEIPVFGDGDTGFGNVTNVARTVRLVRTSRTCRYVYRGPGISEALWTHGR